MKRILLVAQELYPVTKGGAGVVTANQIKQLQNNFYVSLLLLGHDKDEIVKLSPDYNKIQIFDFKKLKNSLNLNISFKYFHQKRSYEIYKIIEKITKNHTFDIIEFYDFLAPAFDTINAKITDKFLNNTIIAVRNHNTLKDISDFEKLNDKNDELSSLYFNEIFCLKNADYVFFQSKYLKDEIQKKHNIKSINTIVSYPPTNLLSNYPKTFSNTKENNILFLGRLQPFKGIYELAEAIKLIYQENKSIKFFLVGSDSSSSYKGGPVSNEIKEILGESINNVEFINHLSQKEIDELTKNIRLAVIPSRFESFCYVAHEVKKRGVPLIINDIPALKDFFIDRLNCIKYNGSPINLSEKILSLVNNNKLIRKISNSPEIIYPAFDEPYRQILKQKNTLKRKTVTPIILDLSTLNKDNINNNKYYLLKNNSDLIAKKKFTKLRINTNTKVIIPLIKISNSFLRNTFYENFFIFNNNIKEFYLNGIVVKGSLILKYLKSKNKLDKLYSLFNEIKESLLFYNHILINTNESITLDKFIIPNINSNLFNRHKKIKEEYLQVKTYLLNSSVNNNISFSNLHINNPILENIVYAKNKKQKILTLIKSIPHMNLHSISAVLSYYLSKYSSKRK